MRLLVLLATLFLACNQPPPAPIPAAGAAITGTVMERVDGAPYRYLRLKTEQGEIWAAVPMESVAKGGGDRGRSQYNQLPCAAFASSFR